MTTAGNNSPALNKPIGYWLKLVDNLLDEGINTIHAETGISRIQWQLMHILSIEKEATLDSLLQFMMPFTGKEQLLPVLEELVAHNIVEKHAGNFKLGKRGLDLHNKCFEKQQAFRKQSMTGITEEDYNTTLETLQKMAANLSK